MRDYPKVLVLSNACFSNSSSNGRTMRNFFSGWPVEKLAQFYIHGAALDQCVCRRYYCVSDGAALSAFLKGKPACNKKTASAPKSQPAKTTGKIQRNAISMLLRDLIWNSMRWAGNAFYEWVEAFSPELILLQAGDCAFLFRLARQLSQRYQIPLVIYNSEAYYFKEFDYFRADGIGKAVYPFFHRRFCREFEKTIKAAVCSIYCCDKLKNDYDKVFGLPSFVVHTGSELVPVSQRPGGGELRISYLGNLGVGRHTGLVEIGDALRKISPGLKLDIYGKLPHEEIGQKFAECKGICFHGFVPYEKVKEVIADSDVLVHTESFEAFYKEDLKYAFSTKIADCLNSGRCFLLYAPENMACTQYLKANQAAWVVDRQESLLPVLKKLTEDVSARETYINAALQLAKHNHSKENSAQRFQQVLRECAEGVL